jgi:DNA-binding CsgD family transcriptional regulator/tetratricopeptide (TPR) repeat protein
MAPAARMLGRDAELGRIGDGVERARTGSPTCVIVDGDAGIGKSRLVREAVAAHSGNAGETPDIVAIGHGIELTGGALPYGTAAETLRTLVRTLGVDAVVQAAGPYADDLATICPPLGMGPNREVDRLRLLPGYAATMEKLGENRLVWLVIEDVHWLDASTRDLLSYLLQAAQPCQLLALLTVRTRDPAFDDETRQVVEALSRLPGAAHLTLSPLSRAETEAVVQSLTGASAPDDLIRRIADLAQGNPLLAEQLVAAGLAATGPLPDDAAQPMIARIRRLDPHTLQVVQVASLADGHLTARLLREACLPALEPHQVDSAIDSAVTTVNVLCHDSATDALTFTHALLRQAAESTMTSSERLRTHRTWARLLTQPQHHGGDRLLQIAAAHHLGRTDNDLEAFDAALTAAKHADWLGGPLEAATLLRGALARWDRIPDAEERAGRSRDAVLGEAIVNYDFAGRLNEVVELLDAEIARSDPESPLRHLLLRVTRTEYVWSIGGLSASDETLLDSGVARINEIDDAEPTLLLFSTLRALGWHLRYRDPDQSFELHARASRVLAELGQGRGAPTGAHIDHLRSRGRFAEGLAVLEHARPHATKVIHQATIECDLGILHHGLGNLGTSATCFETALAYFPEPQIAPGWCAYTSVWAAIAYHDIGDWDRADAALEGAAALDFDDSENRAWVLVHRALFAARRGETERALRIAAEVRPLYQSQYGSLLDVDRYLHQLDAELAIIGGDLLAARSQLARTLDVPGLHAYGDGWQAAALAAFVEAELHEASPEAVGRRDLLRSIADQLPRSGAHWGTYHRQVLADLDRAAGTDDPSAWSGLADGWRTIGHAPNLGWALLRMATARANAGGGKDGAAEPLTEAWTIARRLGARPLQDKVVDLARRTHTTLDVADRPSMSGPLGRLTERELEVLRHVVAGDSNDEIAQALFISPRTASVHVSRILAKLEVTSRAKATAVAYEHGLFATTS